MTPPKTGAPVRALTVQQPWAWAIIHGGKDVENRTWRLNHRGPVLIHASKTLDRAAEPVVVVRTGTEPTEDWRITGAVIGVVDITGWHAATHPFCCSWGAAGQWHIELANPRPVKPIPCRGALGLWVPPADVVDAVTAAIQ